MTITQMRYFYEVCRCQNITKAAAYLHVSQPTISIAMADLEKETGLTLFRKDGKKLILTNDANTLLAKIIPILSSINDLEQDIKDMTINKNVIRLVVPMQIGAMLLPRLYKTFCVEHPKIKLEIIEAGGIDAMRMVEEDNADLSINNFYDDISTHLSYIKLMESEACFCTYEGHHLARKQTVSMDDIAEEQLVLLNGGFFINRLVQSNFTKNKLRPKTLLYSSSLHTVKNFINNKLASSILMRQAITQFDRIIPISFDNPQYINTGIIYKKDRKLYPNEKIFVDYIKVHNELLQP